MNNLVSVIIPCYNAERFIQTTILSVQNQSYQNFEIIVVNDGSTDNSLNIIKNLNDQRIHIIDKENSGVSDSRNIGFQKSKGDFILFLDADDVISDNYFSSALEVFESNNKIDFCTYYIEHIDENNKKINVENKRGTFENIQFEIASFLNYISACPSAYIYRKRSLENNHIKFATNLKSPEDRHFLFKVGKYLNGAIIDQNKAILNYRINQNSLSHNISTNLLLMQEVFYLQTINDDLLNSNSKKIFTRKMSYQLTITFIRLFKPYKAIKYLFLYLKSFLS
jgi:teichuronic acid biosynthesis glycosyltransferase TuaG